MQEDYRDFQNKKCKVLLIIKTGGDKEEVEYYILGPEAETIEKIGFFLSSTHKIKKDLNELKSLAHSGVASWCKQGLESTTHHLTQCSVFQVSCQLHREVLQAPGIEHP